jgi:hypothetical protein
MGRQILSNLWNQFLRCGWGYYLTDKFPTSVIWYWFFSLPVSPWPFLCFLYPFQSLGYKGCQCTCESSLPPWSISVERWGAERRCSPRSQGLDIIDCLLCHSSLSHWLHCTFSHTDREVGKGPRMNSCRGDRTNSLRTSLPHAWTGTLATLMLQVPRVILAVTSMGKGTQNIPLLNLHALEIWSWWWYL